MWNQQLKRVAKIYFLLKPFFLPLQVTRVWMHVQKVKGKIFYIFYLIKEMKSRRTRMNIQIYSIFYTLFLKIIHKEPYPNFFFCFTMRFLSYNLNYYAMISTKINRINKVGEAYEIKMTWSDWSKLELTKITCISSRKCISFFLMNCLMIP